MERLSQARAESAEQGTALATANSSLRERESHLRSIETTLLKSEAKCRNQEELIATLKSQVCQPPPCRTYGLRCLWADNGTG